MTIRSSRQPPPYLPTYKEKINNDTLKSKLRFHFVATYKDKK